MTVIIIDYGAGNLHSAAKAFARAAEQAGKAEVDISSDPQQLAKASHIILPGVGAYGDCIAGLRAANGMIEALEEAVLKEKKPFLGICVGMQMMLERGLEFGEHQGLGWIPGEVVPIEASADYKIPHMGWNELTIDQPDHPVFRGIEPGEHAYFVHSFHAVCTHSADVLARVDYNGPISACIGHGNMVGTQFHPEKSHRLGLRLIENFLGM